VKPLGGIRQQIVFTRQEASPKKGISPLLLGL